MENIFDMSCQNELIFSRKIAMECDIRIENIMTILMLIIVANQQ